MSPLGSSRRSASQVTYVKPGDCVIACLSVFCGCATNADGPSISLRGRRDDAARRTTSRASRRTASRSTRASTSARYAEKMLLHENAVVKIRDDMPLDKAALIGCGVTTGVGAVLNTARIPAGSSVAVFGCGGVGLAAIQGAKIGGARMIIAVDAIENKLAMAKEFGATHIVDASSKDPVPAIIEMTGGGVEYSFEAVGLKIAAEQAFEVRSRPAARRPSSA